MKESAEGLKKLDENGMGDSKKIGEGNFGVVYKVAQWKEEISSENTNIWIFAICLVFSIFVLWIMSCSGIISRSKRRRCSEASHLGLEIQESGALDHARTQTHEYCYT